MEHYQGEAGEELQENKRVDIKVTLDFEPYKVLRGILFRKGLSFQEYINYVTLFLVNGDDSSKNLVEQAIDQKIQERMQGKEDKYSSSNGHRRTNPNELFNLLERASVLANKHPSEKEEGRGYEES